MCNHPHSIFCFWSTVNSNTLQKLYTINIEPEESLCEEHIFYCEPRRTVKMYLPCINAERIKNESQIVAIDDGKAVIEEVDQDYPWLGIQREASVIAQLKGPSDLQKVK